MYLEQGPPDEDKPFPPKKRKLWARRRLGYIVPKKAKAKPPALCTVRTSDGLSSETGKAHNSLIRPMSKLLTLLFDLRRRGPLFTWLRKLFHKITKN